MHARLISSGGPGIAAKEGDCWIGSAPGEEGNCYFVGTMPDTIGYCWSGFLPGPSPQ